MTGKLTREAEGGKVTVSRGLAVTGMPGEFPWVPTP